MKLRVEPQGLHFYCRTTGTHLLLDEVRPPHDSFSLAPRTVSIAITDECDFRCSYCYVNLHDRYMSAEKVISYCKQLSSLGTFDIAFGGGEPTLHPDLIYICKTLWNETDLGISITTHGHHLNERYIDELKDCISFVRVSIDGVEPIYSSLRGKELKTLEPILSYLQGRIPFGINSVINKLTIKHLDELKEFFLKLGAIEWLMLPMWHKGKYVLSESEWKELEAWIMRNHRQIPIRVSSDARKYLNLPYLFESEEWYNDYAFIGVDGKFRKDSYSREGVSIDSCSDMASLLKSYNTPFS